MSIGQVIARLRPDFPDVSISKIRFLEAEGLLEPERAPSGYRKFTGAHVERLRYILGAQRDHYLPLKVIGEHLEAMERGLEPPSTAGGSPRVPDSVKTGSEPATAVAAESTGELRISAAELVANSGLDPARLDEVVGFGLVRPVGDTDYFDADALVVATTIAKLGEYGLEPRHVRAFKSAADREVGLIEQVVSPVVRHNDAASNARAADMAAELTTLCLRLHGALVRAAVRQSL